MVTKCFLVSENLYSLEQGFEIWGSEMFTVNLALRNIRLFVIIYLFIAYIYIYFNLYIFFYLFVFI